MVKEESPTVHSTLEAFIMLKTPAVEGGWGYMETVDSGLECRLLGRIDRSRLVSRLKQEIGGAQ